MGDNITRGAAVLLKIHSYHWVKWPPAICISFPSGELSSFSGEEKGGPTGVMDEEKSSGSVAYRVSNYARYLASV